MPRNKDIKKVLVIGSGPIIIGQAAEFDYAGTQACRSLKEEGIEVVLLNSNPATIMTDKDIADRVYIEPLTVEVVEQLILKEKPDSVLPTLGGQAGLNLAMELDEKGFLKEHNIRLIGTTAQTIKKAEDRQEFKDTMEKIGEPIAASKVVTTVEDGLAFTNIIGYPVVLRPAYTLGGSGGGIAHNEYELREILENVHIPVQVGGGIRSIKDIDQYMNIGVHRVVIGTQAIENPVLIKEAVHLFGSDKILVSIDAKDGLIATEGRKKFSHYNATTVASNMKAMGIESVIYTDILRRGLYNGAGIMQAREIAQKLHMKVIYSGGIVTLKDIEAFTDMPMEGIIIGRALYESRLKLSEAIEVCRWHERSI